ncbi:hypothetical protein PpBr36_02257 [Pyricularia pennisetigena]|uniref:hypothetical protein n=1 Tax=Pyricularia pennisetigena TaxID=1578925 RepID=UPI0011546E7F|nr:hypothetical protein PpBr36_02257 [Pyricularia pennisetigena]TLS30952.1 hypothetical protein PpBr36_02257 [Pyricularia pennisetigena]
MNFQELLGLLLEQAHSPSTPVLVCGILFVVIFPAVLHLILTRTTQHIALPTVLLAGPSGAGKTSLVALFERRGSSVGTHPTQLPHSVELSVASRSGDAKQRATSFRDDLDALGAEASNFLVQDTPGHGKLRGAALGRVEAATADKIRAVVFVVDAAALSEPEALADAAAFLYDVLIRLQRRTGKTTSSRAPDSVPVLIAANKMDLFTALPAVLVKSNLEAELGRIRSTRSRGLLDSGVGADDIDAGAEEGDDWLGQYGSEKFTFSQMREFDIEVDVLAGNVEGDGPGVDKWWEWIADQI